MPECTRTFIAIAVPEPINEAISRLQCVLAPDLAGCRWSRASQFHITLAFLGDVPTPHLSDVCQAAATGVGSIEPFELRVNGLGAFPSPRRPGVLWAGVTAVDLSPLLGLQQSLARALQSIGHPPDDPRFHPHVTLGRIERKHARDITSFVERHQLWSAGLFSVEEITVFASVLGRSGPHYDVLGHGRLASKKNEVRA